MQISNLKIENMENDIQQLQADFQNLFLKFYPVGSIYISTTNVNPQTVFGGEWERWGNGKTIIGVNEDDSTFSSVEISGGEKTHTLSVSELPGHSHIFSGTAHSHTVGNHTHTVPAHAHSLNSHTHSFSDTSSTKTLEGGFECRRYGNSSKQTDVVGIKATSGTHGVFSRIVTAWGGSHQVLASNGSATNPSVDAIHFNGSHNHTVSGTTGKASGNTGNSSVLTSGTATGNTSAATITGSNSSVGNGLEHNNLQPYITCYMWKRIA